MKIKKKKYLLFEYKLVFSLIVSEVIVALFYVMKIDFICFQKSLSLYDYLNFDVPRCTKFFRRLYVLLIKEKEAIIPSFFGCYLVLVLSVIWFLNSVLYLF